eukprot:TRINITY_DN13063_c0_g3_i1.p1 TRINITY_DN13063_c0_g3~~TRINITY_DN13063_c0_g3_i1.p1  ORF type:complete len:710 (+),score=204.51 TRINITY_DN13063_c0_g3_i1:143-2272(+)
MQLAPALQDPAGGIGALGQLGHCLLPPQGLSINGVPVPVAGAPPCGAVAAPPQLPHLPPSVSPEGFGVAGLVPVEEANSRLWSLSMEYERVLTLQRDQHLSELKRWDAEAEHLRQQLLLLRGGRAGLVDADQWRGGGGAAAQAREAEMTLALEASKKELSFLASLLKMRDHQLGDLQRLCESRQAQVRRLEGAAHSLACRGDAAPPFVEGGGHGLRCLADGGEEVQSLRKEKAELERMLVAKDKQMVAAFKAFDPDMPDTSALQLGAQAVQLFHDSLRMREEATSRAQEIEALRHDLGRSRSKVQILEKTAGERRDEIAELSASLATKVRQVLELEGDVDTLQREQAQAAKENTSKLNQQQDEITTLVDRLKGSQQLVEQMKERLAEKDQHIRHHQVQSMQQQAESDVLRERASSMEGQLADAERSLVDMFQKSSHKDRLVRDMTEQITLSESKLHAYQIKDIIGARHKQIEASSIDLAAAFQPGVMSSSDVKDGTLALNENSYNSAMMYTSYLGAAANAVGTGAAGAASAEAAARAKDSILALTAPLAVPLATFEPGAGSQMPGLGYDSGAWPGKLALRSASSGFVAGDSLLAASAPSLGNLATQGQSAVSSRCGSPRSVSHSHQATASSRLLALAYRPHPGDAIDRLLADFVNQPKHQHLQAMFCRLGTGSYLYGSQRLNLRLCPGTGQLQAAVGDAWIPLQEYANA